MLDEEIEFRRRLFRDEFFRELAEATGTQRNTLANNILRLICALPEDEAVLALYRIFEKPL